MAGPTDDADATTDALDHLEDALDAAESDDAKYHLRQALQLLDLE